MARATISPRWARGVAGFCLCWPSKAARYGAPFGWHGVAQNVQSGVERPPSPANCCFIKFTVIYIYIFYCFTAAVQLYRSSLRCFHLTWNLYSTCKTSTVKVLTVSSLQLDPFYASIILFVGRAWDAVTDPTVGFLVSRSPWTRFGRMMPWYVCFCFLYETMLLLLRLFGRPLWKLGLCQMRPRPDEARLHNFTCYHIFGTEAAYWSGGAAQ